MEPNDTALQAAQNPEHPTLDMGANDWAGWGVLTGSGDVDTWLVTDLGSDMEGIAGQAPVLATSPLATSNDPHPLHAFGVHWLDFDQIAYENLAITADAGLGARIEMFQVSDEVVLQLDVRPIEIFADDVTLIAAEVHKGDVVERVVARPDILLFEGSVTGFEDSEVFLSISPRGSNGWIRIGEQKFMIATELEDPTRRAIIYDLHSLPEAFAPESNFTCDGGLDVPGVTNGVTQATSEFIGGTGVAEYEIALESDSEYLQNLFGGNVDEAIGYAATLVAGTNTMLVRDVQSRLKISFIRVWEGIDPWSSNNTSNQIYAFKNRWDYEMEHIDRNLAHFLSGRALGGGVAWVGVLCDDEYGYALSANLSGHFPIPLSQGTGNWDIFVFAHETGHNYGASHTHELCPPLDRCAPSDYFGSCQSSQVCIDSGTIMSYCHLCDGGIANIALYFHPRTQNDMRAHIQASNCGNAVDEIVPWNGFFSLIEDNWAVPVIYRVDYLDADRGLIATTPVDFQYFMCPFIDNGENDVCVDPFPRPLRLESDETYLIEVVGSENAFYNFGFARPTE